MNIRNKFSIFEMIICAAVVALLVTLYWIPREFFDYDTEVVSGNRRNLICQLAVLLAVYVGKFFIARNIALDRTKVLAFIALITLMLPYMYACCMDWPDPQFSRWTRPVYPWIYLPISVLTVPVISFFVFDLNRHWFLGKQYWIRTAVEVPLIFVWQFSWSTCTIFMGWYSL